ncbi:outer membrane protein [Rhizorhabdus sp. FW153]|uniref:outer membrane protein n=1 Tax=Rhizorhabdus sp. FW153 TaxID=3400216 RepID=UPI003CF6CD11
MFMRYRILAAVAAGLIAAPAVAADDAVTFRVEAHGGWDRVTVGGSDDDGLLYGIGLGVDVPIGSMAFIGFEADADLSSTKQCDQFLGGGFCQEAKRDLAAVARVGLKASDKIKVYALAGYTNARIKQTATIVIFPGTITESTSVNGDGFRAGAGVEMKLGSSAYTKLEYRYSNYEGGFSRHQLVAGLGLGF